MSVLGAAGCPEAAYPGRSFRRLRPRSGQAISPSGHQLTSPQVRRLNGGTFFIGQLAKPACAYRSLVLTARTASVTDMHQFSFGGCHPGQLVVTTGGQGSW